MGRYLSLGILAGASLVGCNEPASDYLAASVISQGGFAREGGVMGEVYGREVRLWGYIDHANLYGDAGTKAILGEFWSGDGPDAATWRFDLKAAQNDAAGQSFAVHVPNDARRDEVLRAFVADARARRPTRVFLTGRVFTFAAPTNAVTLTGLYLSLQSSMDICFGAPEEHCAPAR